MDCKLHQKGIILFSLFCVLNSHAQGTEQLDSNLLKDSLEILNSKISTSPNSIGLRLKKASINLELNQWEFAVGEYTFILQKNPHNLVALFFRAYANNRLHKYALVKNDYETFLTILPLHFEARLGLAYINEKLGNKGEAMSQYNILVENHPDSASAFAARANFEQSINADEAALDDFSKAILLSHGNKDYMINKVELLIKTKRLLQAKELLDELVRHGVPNGMLKPWYDKCR